MTMRQRTSLQTRNLSPNGSQYGNRSVWHEHVSSVHALSMYNLSSDFLCHLPFLIHNSRETTKETTGFCCLTQQIQNACWYHARRSNCLCMCAMTTVHRCILDVPLVSFQSRAKMVMLLVVLWVSWKNLIPYLTRPRASKVSRGVRQDVGAAS